ncbi:hypothetical protein HN011_006885 [Eciton burchellii]|nr:hypothetical protein HN011_006885 [Eciton burchellii]
MRWLISLCTLSVLLVHGIEANSDDVPLTKFGTQSGPTLKFAYCYSCGYRKLFEQYASILKEKYPELHIEGQNFNPSGYAMIVAKTIGILKLVIIILIISGFDFDLQIRPLLQIRHLLQIRPVWQWCIDNRFYSCILIFLICNAIEGQLISSGAFEIHFNDVPVWSKLETGRIPQPPELFHIIDFHLNMMFSEVDVGKISFNK